jgi:hypothetical protein
MPTPLARLHLKRRLVPRASGNEALAGQPGVAKHSCGARRAGLGQSTPAAHPITLPKAAIAMLGIEAGLGVRA